MTTNTEATKAGDLLDRMANVLRTAKQHIGHGADPRTPQAKAYWAADAMLAEYDAFRRRATSLAEPALPASDAKIIHGKNCDCQNKIACEDAEERELHGTIRGKPIEPADPSILAHNLRSIADAINPDTNPPNPKSRWWNTRDAVNRLNQIADELDASSVEPASAAEGARTPSLREALKAMNKGRIAKGNLGSPDPAQSADTPSEALTFDAFRAANVARCLKWHPAGIESWSPSDWLTAVTGELGELASLLKMRNRERDGLPGNKFSPTQKQIADEIADVVTYLDLLAHVLGVDLGRAAATKFNEVSERVGFPDRIVLASRPQPVTDAYTLQPARGEVIAAHEITPPMDEADEARHEKPSIK
jgi:NTP pyrophosphatase (non-canonical NTP hydrolase)